MDSRKLAQELETIERLIERVHATTRKHGADSFTGEGMR